MAIKPETPDQFRKRQAFEERRRERGVRHREGREAKRETYRSKLKGVRLKAYDAKHADPLAREDAQTRQPAGGVMRQDQPDSIFKGRNVQAGNLLGPVFQRPLDPTPNIPKAPRQPMSSTPGATLARLKKKLGSRNRIV
jgi:hypothetical protein